MSKITITDFAEQKITVLTYNVDQAVREEQEPKIKWEIRHERVKESLKSTNFTVANLQEIRALDNNISPDQWLSSIGPNFKFVTAWRNATKYSFGLATVYDATKLFLLDQKVYWFSDTPNVPSDTWPGDNGQTGFGSIILFCKFAFVIDGKIIVDREPLIIANLHLPFDEAVKEKCCIKIKEFVGEY